MTYVVGTPAKRGFPQHNLLGDGDTSDRSTSLLFLLPALSP